MNVVDVNILVALLIDDHPHHARARAWWASVVEKDGLVAIPDLVWVGFLRIVTHPRVFPTPRSFDEAWSFVAALMASGRLRAAASGEPIVREVARLAGATAVRGNLVTDTYIAAVATSLGATVVTFDRDFRRFDGLRIHEPGRASYGGGRRGPWFRSSQARTSTGGR